MRLKLLINSIYITAILLLTLYPVYFDTQQIITYQFAPSKMSDILEKRYYYPGDSPIVNWGNANYWLINQLKTPFSLELQDSFESVNLKIYYRSNHPEKIALESDSNRTKSQIDLSTVTLYDELKNPDWTWEVMTTPTLKHSILYRKPGLPDDYPPFENFLQETTELQTIHRTQAFIVKNDLNTEYLSLSSYFELPNIAYILVPKTEELNILELSDLPENTKLMLELKEDLPNDKKQRLADYNFRIVCESYQPGDWAIVEKIEVTLEREPVTIDSFKEYVDKIIAKISGST